jgi:DNA (cytosine-5)-methyltransferase 1
MSLVREIPGKMRNKLKHIDLFSGIGGFSLAFEATQKIETVAFCEIEEYPQKVLKKNFPNVPIYNDITELVNNESTRPIWGEGRWQEIECDILTGGYPCQPFSQAGKRKGEKDDRHLWPFMLEIIKQKRPKFIVAENVAGHITLGLDNVLFDLESEGYSARAVVLPASSVNAHHRRDRVWVIAQDELEYTDSLRCEQHNEAEKETQGRGTETSIESGSTDVADSERLGLKKRATQSEEFKGEKTSNQSNNSSKRRTVREPSNDVADSDSSQRKGEQQSIGVQKEYTDSGSSSWGQFESYLGGRSDGLSAWVDGSWERGIDRVTTNPKNRANRLKALGNAIVPQVAYWIALAILGEEDE